MANGQKKSQNDSNECPSCGAPLKESSVCQWCGNKIQSIEQEGTISSQLSFQFEQQDSADLFEDSIDDFEERIIRKLKKIIGY